MAPAPSTSIATPATTVSPNLHTTSQVVVGFSRDPWTTTTVAPAEGPVVGLDPETTGGS